MVDLSSPRAKRLAKRKLEEAQEIEFIFSIVLDVLQAPLLDIGSWADNVHLEQVHSTHPEIRL